MDENSKVVPLWDPPWYNICNFNVNRGKVRYVSKLDMPGFISNQPFVGCIDDTLSDKLVITDGRYEEGKEWEKMEPIGSGTSAIVYKAIDKISKAVFAVKEYKQEKEEDPLYEATVLSRLEHPNIITLYGVLVTQTTVCMLTEFIDGHTLNDRMIKYTEREGKKLDIPWCMHVFRQMVDPMCYYHDQNVVHYDFKDFNIMVLPDDSIRIIDFGNSKIDDTEANPNFDLDCVTRILLKLLQRTPTKKKESFEDKQLKKILTKLYQEHRGPPPIGTHNIPRCVIPIVKIGFGYDQQARKKRTAKELSNNISAKFISSGPTSWRRCVTAYIRKISQAAGPTTSLQPTQHKQPNYPIPYLLEAETTETGDSGDLAASASCHSSEVNTPSTDLPDTLLDDNTVTNA